MITRLFLILYVLFLSTASCSGQNSNQVESSTSEENILTGADQIDIYLPYLMGKRVALLANQTSVVGKSHLVDTLQALGVSVVKVFGPEHGFRGSASAGVEIDDEIDTATGIPVISLYGQKNKPSKEDLADVDLMIYDLQDVGCRFYTNINALARLMEACYENNKELLILDRPNPNGYLVDGPILDMKYESGIGRFPLPMSHGLTVAEFAQMANGEGWLTNKVKCKLKIIKVANYNHDLPYTLPVSPSPNLNTQQSILLYPSTCLFEGTYLNHGRGTYYPFTLLGSPELKEIYDFSFTPTSIKGMAETPLHMNQVCYGLDLRGYDVNLLRQSRKINLQWIIELYNAYPHKEKFFDSSLSREMGVIENLVGVEPFRQQIISGVSEEEIRKSWEPGLGNYKKIKTKYLLYP